MRSSIVLGAFCALGAVAQIEPAYVTEWITTTVVDWTTVTVTTTVTITPTAEPTTTGASITQVRDTNAKVVQHNPAPQPEPVAEPEPTTTVAPAPVETSWSSTWSTTQPAATEVPTQEPAPAPAPVANDYQSRVLYSHNIHRANHSSPDVAWSSDLAASAQVLASRCVYEHDTSINGGGYGQNIGYGVSADEVAVMISNLMYNNEMEYFANLYGQPTPDMTLFEKWGHFSQIIWKGTDQVGCATVSCPSLGNVDSTSAVPFTVCNYSPAGNYDGEYADNVLQPLGQPMYVA
ncbi:CAP domain-containing protein [Aspergillus egyptiacus]|nr:CAP domain-containing protein [Aspergillus egyptiacus]